MWPVYVTSRFPRARLLFIQKQRSLRRTNKINREGHRVRCVRTRLLLQVAGDEALSCPRKVTEVLGCELCRLQAKDGREQLSSFTSSDGVT